MSKRERYERANMRGGLGVRKKLSEESLRTTYRLNGVRSGFAVARAWDKYRGDFAKGYDIGMIVRLTSSIVQIRWLGDEDISSYSQGDARYEVDRGRWKILGAIQGNPLDPENPIADALTKMRLEHRVSSSANDTPPTEETNDMTREQSNAAKEREAAQKAVANGDLKNRETYTAKQVATRLGTDAKTMRKFFRSSHSTVEPVGQGGRYEFAATDLPKIKREFEGWRKKSEARTPAPKLHSAGSPDHQSIVDELSPVVEEMAEAIQGAVDDGLEDEPSPEELAELENMELDLDDLDEED